VTRSRLFNFCLGMLAGGIFAAMVVSHLCAKRIDAFTKQAQHELDQINRKIVSNEVKYANLEKQAMYCKGGR